MTIEAVIRTQRERYCKALEEINALLDDVIVQSGSNVHHIAEAQHVAQVALGRSVTERACQCENPARGWYTGRDGEVHCEQCDGRKGPG